MKRADEAALRRANPEPPVAGSGRAAVQSLITAEWLAGRDHVRVLDIGSRDGSVTAELQALVRERGSGEVGFDRFFGVDPSSDAIARAEAAHPSMVWINDTLGDWLQRDAAGAGTNTTFDLIVDRGYPSLIRDEEQAEREAAGLRALLAPGGVLIQVVWRTGYAEWSHLGCLGWERSLFEIRAAALGEALRLDDRDCYVIVHGLVPADLPVTEPLPSGNQIRAMAFELADGERLNWDLRGNEELQLRAWHHGARSGRLAPYRFRLLPGSTPTMRKVEGALLERVRDQWSPGRPAVLDPGGAVLGSQGRRRRYHEQLYEHLQAGGWNVLHYPRACPDVRAYQLGVSEWVAAQPNLVVLGPGLTDARHNPDRDGRVVTDIDQFRHILGWVIERLHDEGAATVAWVQFESPPAELLEGGLIRREDLDAFAEVGRAVAQEHGAPVREIAYGPIAPRGDPVATLAAQQLTTIIRELTAAPVESPS